MSLLEGRRLAVIDVETTGWSPSQGASVVEIGRATLEDGAIADDWASLVGPRRPIPTDAVRTHGIREEMLEGAPEPAAIAGPLREACASLPLVFHHAAFDLPFLHELLRQGGVPPLFNALGALAAQLRLPREQAHRALGDARTTARLLAVLAPRWERERGIRSLDELAAASQDVMRLSARRARAERAQAPVAF
jgi:ATP-dependent DNA helicase DinG